LTQEYRLKNFVCSIDRYEIGFLPDLIMDFEKIARVLKWENHESDARTVCS